MARGLRFTVMTLGAVAAMVALAPGAAAGGWWTYVDPDGAAVAGSRVQASGQVMFASIEATQPVRAGQQRFYAYILIDYDRAIVDEAMSRPNPRRWWERPDEARRVARVRFDRWSGNLAMASVSFTVPELKPGRYELMLCDLGCEQAMADVVPSAFTVVTDPTTESLLRRTERLRGWLAMAIRRTRSLQDSLGDAQAFGVSDSELVRVHQRIGSLERRVPARPRPEPTWPWIVVAFLAGAASRTPSRLRPGAGLDRRGLRGGSGARRRFRTPARTGPRLVAGMASGQSRAIAHLMTVTIPTTRKTSPNSTSGPTHQSS